MKVYEGSYLFATFVENIYFVRACHPKSPVIITITGLFLFVSKHIYFSNQE